MGTRYVWCTVSACSHCVDDNWIIHIGIDYWIYFVPFGVGFSVYQCKILLVWLSNNSRFTSIQTIVH